VTGRPSRQLPRLGCANLGSPDHSQAHDPSAVCSGPRQKSLFQQYRVKVGLRATSASRPLSSR
jgi:hypothetical protein